MHLKSKSTQYSVISAFCTIIKSISQSESHRVRTATILLESLVNLTSLSLQVKTALSGERQKLIENVLATLWKIIADEDVCRKALGFQIIENLTNLLEFVVSPSLPLIQNVSIVSSFPTIFNKYYVHRCLVFL